MVILRIAMCGEIVKIAIVHPRFEIDEYAISFRIWVWLMLPHPPMIADVIAIRMVIFGGR